MSMFLKEKAQFIDYCEPFDFADPMGSLQRRADLAADIKPVKFGFVSNWTTRAPDTPQTLATFDVVREKWLIVTRVECYVVDYTDGATDFGMWQPPPPGFAYWLQDVQGGSLNQTAAIIVTNPNAPTHLALDAEEFLVFQPSSRVSIIGVLTNPADDGERAVRTLVYGHSVGPEIVKRLGGAQSLIALS